MSLRAISHQSRAAPRLSIPPREHVWRNALADPWNQTCHKAKSDAGRATTRHSMSSAPVIVCASRTLPQLLPGL
jgi:hypothetical protein